MDTRFLSCFVAFAESGSIAEAARQLNVAPSTLALRIRSLEDELGFALVIRSGRISAPTQAGIEVAARGKSILRDLRDLASAARHDQPHGQLRMGVAPSAIPAVLCDVLPTLADRYPKIDIGVQKGPSSQVFAMLINGDVDVAFLFHPPFILPKDMVWQCLRSERYVVVSAADEMVTDAITLLKGRPFIRYDRSLWSGQIAENFLRTKRIRPTERVELDSLEAIAVLVDRGLGVSLIPDRDLPLSSGLRITKHEIEGPAPSRELGLLWRAGSARENLIRLVRDEACKSS